MSLHCGDRVHIKTNNYMYSKIYIISDISFDKADDGSPIKMYNLYDELKDEIIDEPMYEHELELEY